MQEQINRLLSLHHDKKIQNYAFSMNAVIGRGSYGVVYVGRQIDTGMPVALKVVPTLQVPQETINLILKEIDIMKDLDSQNVVKLIDVVRTGNNYYIVSELCTGGDLKEYMKRSSAMDESVALPILIQILRGILQSFKRGIIHRDLKPANILLTYNQQNQILFKIADFGFAKRFNHLENDLMTSLVGTPLYMSPQVLLRRQYTAKCDVWSIGLIYYELLEGKTPWNVRDILDLVNKQRQTKIQFSKRVSKRSQQFIQGCLAYEEQHRFNWEQVFTHPIFEGVFEKQHSSPQRADPKLDQRLDSKPEIRADQRIDQRADQRADVREVRNDPRMDYNKVSLKTKTLPKRSVSPQNQVLAPVKVKALSNCKNFVKSPGQTVIRAGANSPKQDQERQTVKLHNKTMIEDIDTTNVTPTNADAVQYFSNYPSQPNTYKKDRTVSITNKLQTHDFSKEALSDVKQFKTVGSTQNFSQTDKVLLKKQSQPSTTRELVQNSDYQQQERKNMQMRYQHNLMLNYISEEFNVNKQAIHNHLDYLRYLKTIKSQLSDFFGQSKYQSIVVKLGFLISKHAMIRSNEIKVNLIDKGNNIFDLKEFKQFQGSEFYQQLEKQVVETHFEIFNQFQENFLMINEHLTLVMNDSDFLEIFNNNFEPTLHFARYAYQTAFQFVRDNVQDTIYDSNNIQFLKFCHAIMLYTDHMKSYQFTTIDACNLLVTLTQTNPGFLKNDLSSSVPQLRFEMISMFNKMNCFFDRNL